MGILVEGFSEEFRAAWAAVAGLTLGSALIASMALRDYQTNTGPNLVQLTAAANAKSPDASADDLKQAQKVADDMAAATLPQVLRAKQAVDQHQIWQHEFDQMGGAWATFRAKGDLGVAAISFEGASMGLVLLSAGAASQLKVRITPSLPTLAV